MKKSSAYLWAVAGIAVPAAIELDLNFLGDHVSRNPLFVLAVWPSSFMLSGLTQWTAETIIGLFISLSINVTLYLGVGYLLSRALMLVRLHRFRIVDAGRAKD